METMMYSNRKEEHLSFITINWPMLAIAAYDGFMHCGRGMVVIQEREFSGRVLADIERFSIQYMGISDLVETDIVEGQIQMLRQYDPARMAIIGVRCSDAGIRCYQIVGQNVGLPVILWHAEQDIIMDRGDDDGCGT